MNNPRHRASRQTSLQISAFRGTRDLQFTPEEMQAIQAAEQGLRPWPPIEAVVFCMALLAVLFIFLIVGGVVYIAASLSSHTQIQAQSVQTGAQFQESGTGAHVTPPQPATGSPGNIPLGKPIVPEIEPQLKNVPEPASVVEAKVMRSENLGAMPVALDIKLTEKSEAEEESENISEAQAQENQQFTSVDEMAEVLAQKGYLAELERKIRERRATEVKAEKETVVFKAPRFNSDILTRINLGSHYYVIDTHLRCNKIEGLTFTWKIAFLESHEGLVCTPEERTGTERQ